MSLTPRMLQQRLPWLQNRSWKQTRYEQKAALISRDGTRHELYTGQTFDPKEQTLVERAWTHDHCIICTWSIGESAELAQGSGYTDGQHWLCIGCGERFAQDSIPE
ncbi:hypothetical protein [Armatimonas sp.]|uniref:hypothetical protein n=1 Tax=Armatimonas sp. TaxID=1872638 RepID=UPI0037513465